jgi:hypothetical protein
MPPARLVEKPPAARPSLPGRGGNSACPMRVALPPLSTRSHATQKGDDTRSPPDPGRAAPLAAPVALFLLDALAAPPPAAALAIPTSLPSMLDFLLHNPLLAALVAGAAVWGVPRLVRALTTAIILPLALLALAATAATEPEAALRAASTISSFILTHPVLVSSLALGGAALALSPYLLLAGVAALLAFGLPRLPAPLRPALPAPLVEVERGVDRLRATVRTALAPALAEGGRAVVRVKAAAKATAAPGQAVADGAGRAGAALAGAAARVEATATQATACRAKPTPDARAACVRRQNEG